jgi:hypothetical protein
MASLNALETVIFLTVLPWEPGAVRLGDGNDRIPQAGKNHLAFGKSRLWRRAMRMLGIIGGTSWESSLEYYRLLNQGVASRLGSLDSARLTLASVDFQS